MPSHLGQMQHRVAYTSVRRFQTQSHARKVAARIYARRLLARMCSWPPARKSRARCKLQTHQPQLTEYDSEETLKHRVAYTSVRRFETDSHARKVAARICA